MIAPFNEKQLTPNGYDLAIKEIEVAGQIMEPKEIDGKRIVVIPPMKRFIILTKEKLIMPPTVMALLAVKTKRARIGVFLSPGFIDAGFIGQLNLCCLNADDAPINIDIDATFVQVVFPMLTRGADKVYAQRSGNYQNQNKIMK